MISIDLPAGRIAIVGLAKNCGKTTTLNSIARALLAAGHRVGMLSIGIDGETSDVLIGTPKPPVHVAIDQMVVTADQALSQSSAKWEWIESLGIHTPLGEAVLARCRAPGDVILGGLRHREDVIAATDILLERCATHVLIDGAYGRVTAAAPDLSDAVILSTGAVLSDDEDDLARLTVEAVRRLELPRANEPALREMGVQAKQRGVVLLGSLSTEAPPTALESSSALLGLQRERDRWRDDMDAVAISGLVSDGVIDELLSLRADGRLVVPNATVFHCSSRRFNRLCSRWDVTVLDSVRVVGVALNPTSVTGGVVDEAAVRRAILEACPHLTVFNPALGLHST